jgi:hypothetical protein
MSLTLTRPKSAGLAVALLALTVLVAACGKATSAATPPSTIPKASPSVSPTTQIKTNWMRFFAGTTPAARKIALLQNGQAFAAIIQAQAGLPIARGTQAKVLSVRQTSPTTAVVTYTITIGGKVALANQKGQAVKQGGVWKVGDSSFQALLAREGNSAPSSSPGP